MIVGHDQQNLKNIKFDLKDLQSTFNDLRIATVRPGYMDSAIDSKLRALVFDTNTINKNLFPFIVQVRKAGFGGPLIVLGTPSSSFDLHELAMVKNVFQLDKPYQPEQLSGLVKNVINVETMRQRRDQRFSVREHATIEAYRSDLKRQTLINNISRSGVRIEGDLAGLKAGDLLRLHFNFDQIKKERTMSARVVWVKKESDTKEEAGLEFVSQKAVYQYLLDDVAA